MHATCPVNLYIQKHESQYTWQNKSVIIIIS
jgi:hypothetical protein